jgi:hypothetical protein
VIGACFLLVHDHTAASGANSPEAHAYLVNPALDQDGKPHPIPVSDPAPAMDHSTMTMDPSMAMDHSSMDHPMDHSSMPMADDPAPTEEHSDHHHHMTPSMLLVEREHLWFTIVGLGVALFKLISDGNFFRNRFIQYVWPSGMALLGVLLVLYHE